MLRADLPDEKKWTAFYGKASAICQPCVNGGLKRRDGGEIERKGRIRARFTIPE
jgi:hypothetical protein